MTTASNPSPTRIQSPCSEGVEIVASEREVRRVDTMDYVIVNASSQRCQNCRKDRQKAQCTRTDANQVKCDRCAKSGYTCTVDDVNTPFDGKRRKLERLKCEACRSAKVKCEPVDRTWPDHCIRCIKNGLPCSEPQTSNRKRVQADGRTAPVRKSVDGSNDSSDCDREMPLTHRPHNGPRTPARIPTKDIIQSDQLNSPVRHIRTPRRSLSDVVDHIYPPKGDYIYTPLKDGEIRLLILHPSSYGQEIVCSFVTEPLQNCRPYQAVSYRWGEDAPNKPIKILSYKPANKFKSIRDVKGSRIYTRSNLFEALQQLRQSGDNTITLFANALCINHDDLAEAHAQASRTQEIFNQASNVIVWLGTEMPTTKLAFEFIPKVLDMNEFDKLIKEGSNSQFWDALVELMRNPLFSRRWLIQELAVAKSAALQCGPHTIRWTDFSDAVALFEANLPQIQRYSKFSLASGGPVNDIRALGASTLVSVVNNVIRKTSDGKILHRLESTETLISLLAVFKVTKPLDVIISVVGLARDGAQLGPIIDNRKEIRDNYIDFVAYCIASSRGIDIICRHWAPVTKDKTLNYMQRSKGIQSDMTKLPSWIPNVSGSAFGAPDDNYKDKQSGRVHGDSFVGLPDHTIYNASNGFPPAKPSFGAVTAQRSAQQQQQYTQYDGTLTTQGLILAHITDLGARASSGIVLRECLELGGWDSTLDTVPEHLWRTLVADRGPNNTTPPSWYHRACLHCLEQASGVNGDINTSSMLNLPKCTRIVADFLRRVQSVVWDRKFFLCERPGKTNNSIGSGFVVGESRLFGLAPGGTMGGDLVCILYGCSVPVVLRRHMTEDDHYFEVIGECFVYGMMDGEAREGLSDEEVTAKTLFFKLR